MSIPPHTRPQVSVDEARRVLREHFERSGDLSPLPSERDQNFRVRVDGVDRWLLKISNAGEERPRLDMEDRILRRLVASDNEFSYPEPVGEPLTLDGDRAGHLCRLYRWVAGRPLAECRPRTLPMLTEVGRLLGSTAAALTGFDDPASRRELQWDLERALEICLDRAEAVADGSRRSLLERWLERIEAPLARATADLRRSVIQNDGNDHNIICGPMREGPKGWRRGVVGLIDVGDAIESPTVVECAVATAYAILDREDPLGAASALVAGFHERLPLTAPEIELLLDLTAARLCLSVCNSAVQQAAERDNPYLSVSERAAWRALEQLDGLPAALVHYRLRAACGLEPCPTAPAIRDWLRSNRDRLAPVLEPTPRRAHVFDLGVDSTEMGGGAPGTFDTARLSDRLFGILERTPTELGIGRYDEARCWYGGELFAAPGDEAPRRRTVHVGIDLFAAPGTELHSPLAGEVVAARWNRGRLDYGPTLVLEHEPEESIRFWTLWGHLDPECLETHRVGDRIDAGDRIARVGAAPDNGDWPPHLHLQILCDRLGHDGDFPGVVDPEERAVWTSVCPDPHLLWRAPETVGAPLVPRVAGNDDLLERRGRYLSPSLSVSYRRPLHIVRGFRQHLYDADGQPFLDAVNNVPHVGHSHPRVVAAAADQSALLNTNTRYLHEGLVTYAERLAGRFPEPLSVCFLVCSGSEANELAVRLARAATGARGLVALEGGYHGNTSTLVDLSHYKHAGPGGAGPPEWVRVAPMPDVYRGRHRGAEDPAAAYASEVGRAARELADGVGLAGFLVEALLGCGGQIVPPEGYLTDAFEQVRAAGGVAIADEVQIGLGRVGSHFWAFEQQGAVPDIVTLGKPLGNGFPLAAVVTTPAIADAFNNGMEYFNTFGGNPVACAVGHAVLDVIDEEGLQENARVVGKRMLDRLRPLAERHRIVGDVRGVGYYLGVELVRDRESLEPADTEAAHAVNRMREHGVLVSTDGPDHNVVKIKPPLCFDADDADRLVETLDRVLSEDLPEA